ncbi:MAG: pilin [Patescibacteria group bacterium]|nr:pilin [Patescibacteria group bacterium]
MAQTNKDFKDATCTIEDKDASCKLVKDGGICLAGPMNVLSFKLASYVKETKKDEPKNETTNFEPTLLKLNVDIPGLSFTNPYLDGNQVIIPYLGQYIQALYKFLLGVALIASAIMIIVGGYKYIIAATGAKVESGKQMIIDALMGMVIVLGAYVILSNVNPNLTQFGSLTVPFVEEELFILSKKDHKALAGGSSYYNGDENISSDEVIAKARQVAAERGIDPCIAEAIVRTESSGKIGAIGHDENFNYVRPGVTLPQARVNFLRLRIKYSGEKFSSDIPIMPSDCNASTRSTCAEISKTGPLNDDLKIDPNDEYFGMDHREGFSHGFGISQLTLWPNDKCNGKWGKQLGSKCFTPADLLTLDGGIDALLSHPAVKPGNSAEAVFKAYIGKPNPGLLSKKMGAYQLCKNKK